MLRTIFFGQHLINFFKYYTLQRGCVFKSEGKTVLDNTFYSYSDCLSDCKLKSILAICECIPFFLPVLESYVFSKQICSISDIACLNKHKGNYLKTA